MSSWQYRIVDKRQFCEWRKIYHSCSSTFGLNEFLNRGKSVIMCSRPASQNCPGSLFTFIHHYPPPVNVANAHCALRLPEPEPRKKKPFSEFFSTLHFLIASSFYFPEVLHCWLMTRLIAFYWIHLQHLYALTKITFFSFYEILLTDLDQPHTVWKSAFGSKSV